MISRRMRVCTAVGLFYGSLFALFHLIDVYTRPPPDAQVQQPELKRGHIDGLRLERDGSLNRDFHPEVFLGKRKEEFDEDSEPRKNREKLVQIFGKVDVNADHRVTVVELQRWIMNKTREHFQQAMEENKDHFKAVDPDGDGRVSWDEYWIKFLVSKGMDEKEIAKSIKNNEDLKIDEETEEVLDNLQDCWMQADDSPQDQLLTEHEFLAFQHPEHSRGMLRYMVHVIIRDLDQDKDQKLSASEFASLPVGTVENQEQDIDDEWVQEHRREFTGVIDTDHDGLVTRQELEAYMDPMNEHNALSEARQMIAVADEDEDESLNLEEVLRYSEYFTGSKLMDYARNVHEEF
uniref:45 kDa calcium-binding protein-like n=1 Tax=Myxine glutinosa TaxID=7769 RepID=UPI00358E52B2